MSDTVKVVIEIPKEAKQAFDKAESNDLKGGYYDHGGIIGKAIQSGIPLDENKGEWIYDKSIYNWKCSRCGQAPKTMGYVGTADFMTTHFKFCNHCGARMEGCEE